MAINFLTIVLLLVDEIYDEMETTEGVKQTRPIIIHQ